MGSRPIGNSTAASNATEVVLVDGTTGVPYSAGGGGSSATNYASPDGRKVAEVTNGAILFTDDFGGAAVDTTVRWDVIDGGLGANPTLHSQSLTQGAIGSGVTGITDAVSGSALTVTMGTTASAERWYLSQQAFAGAEDLLVIASKSQALVANDIFIGLVEVDPTTLIPLLNPNLAAYFTNMGGVQLGATATATAFTTQAIGDSSGAIAPGSTGTAAAALSTSSEFVVEFHAEDVIASNGTVDSAAAKASAPSRVSTQTPNDGKVYKLLMRFRNIGTPGSSTTVTVQRIMVWDSQELRVEVASGRGDNNGQKAVAVNVANAVALAAGNQTVGTVFLKAQGVSAGVLISRIVTGASGVIKAGAGQVYGWNFFNTNAAVRYMQIYNKTTAGVPGTDTPVLTIPLAIGGSSILSSDIGAAFATGISWAITTDAPGATIGASGDVVGNGFYA